MPQTHLIADIGGTHARFALYTNQQLYGIKTLLCADYPDIEHAVCAYLKQSDTAVSSAALAVATPVTGDTIRMTNHHWSFSATALKKTLKLDNLLIINDFTAQALAVLKLSAADTLQVRAGHTVADTPIAVIGPGTGLGVSGLIPCNGQYTALAGEGGHVSIAPCNDTEWRIFRYAQNLYPHVSAERLISGAGLSLIDRALAPAGEAERSSAQITAAAANGESRARQTLDLFSAFLATTAANLALTLGARGGVYLCGGILPRIADYFIKESPFKERFIAKGRFTDYLRDIPVKLVIAPNPGLLGAAEALQQQR